MLKQNNMYNTDTPEVKHITASTKNRNVLILILQTNQKNNIGSNYEI